MKNFVLSQELNTGSIQKELFLEILEQIKDGKLSPGEKLPSVRELSSLLGISRTTVENIYQELLAEGWIFSRNRKGYFISHDVILLNKGHNSQLQGFEKSEAKELFLDSGQPDDRLLSEKEILNCTMESISKRVDATKQIVSYVERTKDMGNGHVVISPGSQQSIYVVLQEFRQQGKKTIAIEEYSYKKVFEIAKFLGFKILPLKIGQQCVDIDFLKANGKKIDVLYLTTQLQFPTTKKMSFKHKIEIVELSRKYNFQVIEDNYEDEFYYTTHPAPSLYSLANGKRVIHISTFSKLISPAFRIGYIVANKKLATRYHEISNLVSGEKIPLEESIIAKFIEKKFIDKHFRRARRVYKRRSKYFIKKLKLSSIISSYFNVDIQINGGTSVWLECKHMKPEKLKVFLEKQRIYLAWSDLFKIGRSKQKNWFVRVGFASYTANEIDEKISILESTLKRF